MNWGDREACARCGAEHPSAVPCPPPAATPLPGASAPDGVTERQATPDPLIGTRVGSFHVVKLIGQGGMGRVYLAEHPAIGSRVAIKFLDDRMASSPEAIGRFYDEARAVNLIGHENIVAIYDLAVLPNGLYYFVMEHLEGETLGARLARGRLAALEALDVLVQLTDALQCAHERGVVHRDLKPENVFLLPRRGKKHFVKLVDFGIAKLRDEAGRSGRTQTGFIVGTPDYMAPEQCDQGPVDARTDVYALGVMAYELLAGRLPFAGRSVAQLLLAHLQQAPPPPSALEPTIDPVAEQAILRALQKRPDDRFRDMAAFGEALAAALEHERARQAPAHPASSQPSPLPRGGEGESSTPEPTVEVRVGSGPARTLAVAELTRGGLFLRAEGALPPLFSRVELRLAHPALRATLTLRGEVVRQVAPAEAGAWRVSPGFAVQLIDLTPEARAALAAVEDARREAGPATTQPLTPDPPARLAELEARGGTSHYAFLGLPLDAEFAEIRRAAKALRSELEALRAAPGLSGRATRLLARLDTAAQALAIPSERLAYDALRGNHRGVARCVSAGIPAALVEARRREFLADRPGNAVEAQRQLSRAQVARKMSNAAAATAAYEAALAADPLDLGAHEAYLAFRRESSGSE